MIGVFLGLGAYKRKTFAPYVPPSTPSLDFSSVDNSGYVPFLF